MLAGIASADPRIQVDALFPSPHPPLVFPSSLVLQMIALRYLQKLFVESIDVSPVQACEMCSELIRSCVSSFSGVCAHDPGEVVSSQTTRFTLLKYKLLHSMVTQLSQTWVYVPVSEALCMCCYDFSLLLFAMTIPTAGARSGQTVLVSLHAVCHARRRADVDHLQV